MLEFAVALVHHDQRHLYNRIPSSHNSTNMVPASSLTFTQALNKLLACMSSFAHNNNIEEQSCKSGDNSRCGVNVTNVDFVSVKVEV